MLATLVNCKMFQGQKSLALDTAIGMWQLLFAEREWPLVNHWCDFLQVNTVEFNISSRHSVSYSLLLIQFCFPNSGSS